MAHFDENFEIHSATREKRHFVRFKMREGRSGEIALWRFCVVDLDFPQHSTISGIRNEYSMKIVQITWESVNVVARIQYKPNIHSK